MTLTDQDQIRAMTVHRVLEGAVTGAEAAAQLGLSVRQVRRLVAAYRAQGVASLPHGNRGRPPAHSVAAAVRERVVDLSRTTYAGTNDSHFCELLAEREGIVRSRSTGRRLRRAAEEPSPRQRRPPTHRQRRERRPQEGMLLQLDGSPHAWLEERGPRLTLLAAIDDATGTIAGAVWRTQEDSLGSLALLEQIVPTHGCPEAVSHDRSGSFVHHDHERASLAEQLAGEREPRQVARAFAALGIAAITAPSPQAKGRVERLFGTMQDRLVVELRLAGATTLAAATTVLADYLPKCNATFAVPAAQAGSADRPLPAGRDLRQIWCLVARRVVANDDTIQIDGQRLQLLPGRVRRTYVRATVEVRQHLDGRRSIWHETQELAWQPAPADARTQRAATGAGAGVAGGRARPPATPAPAFNLDADDRAGLAPAPLPTPAPRPSTPWKPATDHAWRAGFTARTAPAAAPMAEDKFTDQSG